MFVVLRGAGLRAVLRLSSPLGSHPAARRQAKGEFHGGGAFSTLREWADAAARAAAGGALQVGIVSGTAASGVAAGYSSGAAFPLPLPFFPRPFSSSPAPFQVGSRRVAQHSPRPPLCLLVAIALLRPLPAPPPLGGGVLVQKYPIRVG